MKAIIVKDNDFKTIGFEVTSNAKTLFSWGISPVLKSNFQKEVSVEEWMPQIFDLVRLKEQLRMQEGFQRAFFDTAKANDLIKEGKGVDFGGHKIGIDATKQVIKNIISNII